jgi:hypothetical protein
MARTGRPRKEGKDSLDNFFEEQFHRVFTQLWVTLPHAHVSHVSVNERRLREDRARRLSEVLAEEADHQENRK